MKEVNIQEPRPIPGDEYRYDAFCNRKTLFPGKKRRLPAMGWNSWNAFGSSNTEALTLEMAEAIKKHGLDRLGYRYVVLDDGCYKPERVDGKLSNEEMKFPHDFKYLSDAIHDKGLKFGMYNDIGTRLCTGAWVGTCGHEKDDAVSYLGWGVDFLKVDNCYYLYDDATFSDASNARFVFTPKIRGIALSGPGLSEPLCLSAVRDGILIGTGAVCDGDSVMHIGTLDGTGPEHTPNGVRSSELHFRFDAPCKGEYYLTLDYASGQEKGIGSWLQLAVTDEQGNTTYLYDGHLKATEDPQTFTLSDPIRLQLAAGRNTIRVMNHRRQENTLLSYAALLEGLNQADPDHDIVFSLCEWGKTQPQNWAYKVGASWRILNDITFAVGSPEDHGKADWEAEYTNSVTSQYNKAVIMDTYAGLDQGWNDPDMMVIGMQGMTDAMNRTHMTMWCMMNSPLMLGFDLRRLDREPDLLEIVANEELIALNQDPLGIQAKRIGSVLTVSDGARTDDACLFLPVEKPDTEYITNNNRVDILAKPLADHSFAVSFINVSQKEQTGTYEITLELLEKYFGRLTAGLTEASNLKDGLKVRDLWTKEETVFGGALTVKGLKPCENRTFRICPEGLQ